MACRIAEWVEKSGCGSNARSRRSSGGIWAPSKDRILKNRTAWRCRRLRRRWSSSVADRYWCLPFTQGSFRDPFGIPLEHLQNLQGFFWGILKRLLIFKILICNSFDIKSLILIFMLKGFSIWVKDGTMLLEKRWTILFQYIFKEIFILGHS